MAFNRVYKDSLRLPPGLRGSISLPCPFHPDTSPSLSINLEKAVFYCHGGCDEPKGGGAADFWVKWRKLKDGAKLTKSQAWRELTMKYGRRLPSAQESKAEMREEELAAFAILGSGWFADEERKVRREADLLANAIQGQEVDEEVWELLAALYKELTFLGWATEVCISSTKNPMPELSPILAEAKRLGLWSTTKCITMYNDWRDYNARAQHLDKELEQCRTVKRIPKTPVPPLPHPRVPRTPVK